MKKRAFIIGLFAFYFFVSALCEIDIPKIPSQFISRTGFQDFIDEKPFREGNSVLVYDRNKLKLRETLNITFYDGIFERYELLLDNQTFYIQHDDACHKINFPMDFPSLEIPDDAHYMGEFEIRDVDVNTWKWGEEDIVEIEQSHSVNTGRLVAIETNLSLNGKFISPSTFYSFQFYKWFMINLVSDHLELQEPLDSKETNYSVSQFYKEICVTEPEHYLFKVPEPCNEFN